MCVPNTTFQVVNPTTQVALYALCMENCINILSISWNIYQGDMNVSSNTVQWNIFNQTAVYQNKWFFGTEYFLRSKSL